MLNIASGPAKDLKEIYELLSKCDQLKTTCIDMDANAIEDAKEINRLYIQHIDFVNKNVFRYKPDIQHDLVWSAGLFDYFEDKAFVMMLRRMKEWAKKEVKL